MAERRATPATAPVVPAVAVARPAPARPRGPAKDPADEVRDLEQLVRGQYLHVLEDNRVVQRVMRLLTDETALEDGQFVKVLLDLAKAFLPTRASEPGKQAQAITVNIAGIPRAKG